MSEKQRILKNTGFSTVWKEKQNRSLRRGDQSEKISFWKSDLRRR